MAFKCREENGAMKECLTAQWVLSLLINLHKHKLQQLLMMWLSLSSISYKDPSFFEECKQEYIKEKLEFERTGIPTKSRKQKLPTSM